MGDASRQYLLVSSTDFFFPLIDDPYLQGVIACANVFSDLYALGVTEIQSVLMILAVSDAMQDSVQKEAFMKLLMEGFCEGVRLAGSIVSGGQTVRNTSPIIGGVASAVIESASLVRNDCIQVGDYLVLTKPLGTDTAVRRYTLLHGSESLPDDAAEIGEAYDLAVRSMAHLNRVAGGCLLKHQSTGATDITGFGLLGHAENLASVQRTPVSLRFFLLPCIRHTVQLGCAEGGTWNTKLVSGRAVETSGGLLAGFRTLLEADAYIEEVGRTGGTKAWVVGRAVEKGNEAAFLEALPEDEPLFQARHGSSRTYTVAVKEVSTSIQQASTDSKINVLEVKASEFFLREDIESEIICRYDQEALAKRLS